MSELTKESEHTHGAKQIGFIAESRILGSRPPKSRKVILPEVLQEALDAGKSIAEIRVNHSESCI